MHVYLACFDISDDSVRYRVGSLLARHGNRVQRSVFEVSFRHSTELDRLQEALRELPLGGEDDIRFYALCRACRGASHDLDSGRIAHFPAAVIL